MNTSHLAVFVGVCSLILAGFIVSGKITVGDRVPRAQEVLSESVLRIYANENGSASTTEYVRTTAMRYSAANRHLAAHALGQVLFEREGAERAFSMCGSLFGYGCLHQIISQVSPEEELDTAAEVLTLCNTIAPTSPGNCLHAAGHSLVYTAGYTEDAFRDVLTECRGTLPLLSFDEEQSCYGGAFMEYNMRFMQDGAFTNGHTQAATVPFCLSLSDEQERKTCIFWMIPKAHATQNFYYTNQTFSTLGRFCSDSVPTKYHDQCFSSIGRSIGLFGYLKNGTVTRYCTLATEQNPQYYPHCIRWAARTANISNARANITPLCETLPSTGVASCIAFSESFPD